jgi:hypothetical protein
MAICRRSSAAKVRSPHSIDPCAALRERNLETAMQTLRFIRPLFVGALVLLAGVQHASASFVRTDGQLGANTQVLDTTTDLQWLRIDLTYSLSYEFVTSNLGSGGLYDGFRVASSGDLLTLFSDGQFNIAGSPDTGVYTPAREAANAQFVTAFGGAAVGGGAIATRGRYDTSFSQFQQAVGAAYYTPGSVGSAYDSAFVPEGYIDAASPTVGTWLIAPAVPEPGTYALMVAGLMVVGGVARRKAARKANDARSE